VILRLPCNPTPFAPVKTDKHIAKVVVMRLFPAVLVLLATVALSPAKESVYPLVYEGGHLPLHRDKAKAALVDDRIVLTQGSYTVTLPLKSVTRISCGAEARRRLADIVLDAVPLMHWGEGARYIGLTWTEAGRRHEAVFRLAASDYARFLPEIERLTGVKAIDPSHTPTVVRYVF
jgi:hypothetical protein